MIVPDANLLLYAYDAGSPYHEAAATWWSASLSGREPVGLATPTLFAFLRISTSPRAYEHPLSLSTASAHIAAWRERKVVRELATPPSHIDDVIHLLTAAASSGGNLVTDAQIAALAKHYGGVVHTSDRDFLRFPDVKVRYPLAQ